MTNRRFSSARPTRGSPRGGARRTGSLVWRGIASTGLVTLGIGTQLILEILDSAIDNIANATIMRILGHVDLRASATNSNLFWRLGVILVSDDAIAVSAVPDPFEDAAAWMYENSGLFSASNINEPQQMTQLPIDIRVKRRMPQEDLSLAMILENMSGSSTSFTYFGYWKVLLRIP